MEKFTTEYAKKLSIINVRGSFQQNSYIMGYMKAIEETAALDMFEFITRMVSESNFIDEQDKQEAINLINKATK